MLELAILRYWSPCNWWRLVKKNERDICWTNIIFVKSASAVWLSSLVWVKKLNTVIHISPTCSLIFWALLNSHSLEKNECSHSFTPIFKNWMHSWSSLFFQSFVFFKFPMILWVLNVGIEVCHLRHKIFKKSVICWAVIFKDPKSSSVVYKSFWAAQNNSKRKA